MQSPDETVCNDGSFLLCPLPGFCAPTLSGRARERGVLVNAFGPRTVRAVTHLDVTRDQCERAATVLVELLAG